MTTVMLIVGACILIFLILKWASIVKRHNAAVNVLLAKYTYENVDDNDKQRVRTQTADILARVLRLEPEDFYNEAEQFGWYAIAMAELGISPAVKVYCYPSWYHVKNPYTAVFPNDKMFMEVSKYIARKSNINIVINTYDRHEEEYKNLVQSHGNAAKN